MFFLFTFVNANIICSGINFQSLYIKKLKEKQAPRSLAQDCPAYHTTTKLFFIHGVASLAISNSHRDYETLYSLIVCGNDLFVITVYLSF
jgi:hypothetical protein